MKYIHIYYEIYTYILYHIYNYYYYMYILLDIYYIHIYIISYTVYIYIITSIHISPIVWCEKCRQGPKSPAPQVGASPCCDPLHSQPCPRCTPNHPDAAPQRLPPWPWFRLEKAVVNDKWVMLEARKSGFHQGKQVKMIRRKFGDLSIAEMMRNVEVDMNMNQ